MHLTQQPRSTTTSNARFGKQHICAPQCLDGCLRFRIPSAEGGRYHTSSLPQVFKALFEGGQLKFRHTKRAHQCFQT